MVSIPFRNPNFNPHSRKGSDDIAAPIYLFQPISTHTPARGVTAVLKRSAACALISTHTPARGVTSATNTRKKPSSDFNPHSRKGSDRIDRELVLFALISTHTPARGVTLSSLLPLTSAAYFNPHSRKGSDSGLLSAFWAQPNFNPHSRKGSDQKVS